MDNLVYMRAKGPRRLSMGLSLLVLSVRRGCPYDYDGMGEGARMMICSNTLERSPSKAH